MSLNPASSLSINLQTAFGERAERAFAPVVPMYTPLWHATRVMSTTANNWWEGGVAPAGRRGQRAAKAVAEAAVGVARRLHVVRTPQR